ncbi:hypothetical protein ACLBWP_10425 [Microbacterium sp. M1A1_1b]
MRDATSRATRMISREDASSRITAYVYGNIVALATVASLTSVDAERGASFRYVLATSVTTFLAHTFAESMGRRARSDEPLTWSVIRAELRDSLPVLTSGVVPAVVFGLAWVTGLPGLVPQVAVLVYLIVRLGLIGPIVARIRGEKSSTRTVVAGIGLAAIAVAVAVAKAVLGG